MEGRIAGYPLDRCPKLLELTFGVKKVDASGFPGTEVDAVEQRTGMLVVTSKRGEVSWLTPVQTSPS